MGIKMRLVSSSPYLSQNTYKPTATYAVANPIMYSLVAVLKAIFGRETSFLGRAVTATRSVVGEKREWKMHNC